MEKLPVQSDVLNNEIEKLTEVLGRREVRILETGCIRCADEPHRIGDGWSTLTFATYVQENGGRATSVDLDTSSAATVLKKNGLTGYADLVQGDSLAYLDSLVAADRQFDMILLDSASDPEHILREWDRAVQMVGHPGVILIDDVQHDAETCGTKGSLIIERLARNGVAFRGLKRWSGFAWIGMMAIDF